MGGGVDLPNVSYTADENKVYYNPYVEPTQPNNEIWYISTDGNIVEPYSGSTTPFLDASGKNISIVSNTYENGKGIIKLEKDCYQIGRKAFEEERNLANILIPNSVISIDDYAFYYCSLAGITIPDSVTYIGSLAFSHCPKMTNILIPESVTSIGDGAFAGWTGATSTDIIVFPNEQLKTKYFEVNNAFDFWPSLTSVIIPNGTTKIGEYAFDGCKELSEIEIPSSVTSIGKSAFSNCSTLYYITFTSTNPPILNGDIFADEDGSIIDDVTILVPEGALENYQNADIWSEYANNIEENV